MCIKAKVVCVTWQHLVCFCKPAYQCASCHLCCCMSQSTKGKVSWGKSGKRGTGCIALRRLRCCLLPYKVCAVGMWITLLTGKVAPPLWRYSRLRQTFAPSSTRHMCCALERWCIMGVAASRPWPCWGVAACPAHPSTIPLSSTCV